MHKEQHNLNTVSTKNSSHHLEIDQCYLILYGIKGIFIFEAGYHCVSGAILALPVYITLLAGYHTVLSV